MLGKLRSGENLTAGQQFKLTMILAVPAILAQLSMCLMSYIDASMVGRLGSAQAAAVGLVSSTTWIFGSLCYASGSGFSVQIAHRCGAGDFTGARKIFRQGLFTVPVSDHFEHYVRPQENMAHTDTEFAACTDATGHGLLFTPGSGTMSVNCSHFTPATLTETRHDFELVPMKETCLCLDYRQTGIGSNSCGPSLLPEYAFSETGFRFSLRISGMNIADTDLFAEADRV